MSKLAAEDATDWDLKYRPDRLEDVIGQPEAVACVNGWKHVPRAVLLHGYTGCGKTTMARIIVKRRLKCHALDYREINCGMTNATDMVRGLSENVTAEPLDEHRALILDEAQVLGGRNEYAQNMLLKQLEDGPDFLYFFLLTTNPEKLLKTVRGRCKSVAIKPVAPAVLVPHLKRIAEKEDIDPFPDARLFDAIAAKSNGSVRDAVNMLQNVAGVNDPALRSQMLTDFTESKEAFDLAKELLPFKGAPSWPAIVKLLGELKDEAPETIRQVVLATARSRMLNPKNSPAELELPYKVIRNLDQPLYDKSSGHALLAAACFRIVFASKQA